MRSASLRFEITHTGTLKFGLQLAHCHTVLDTFDMNTDPLQIQTNSSAEADLYRSIDQCTHEIQVTTMLLGSLSRVLVACQKFNHEHPFAEFFECTGKEECVLPTSRIQRTSDELAGLKSVLESIVDRCTMKSERVRLCGSHTSCFLHAPKNTNQLSGGQLKHQLSMRALDIKHQQDGVAIDIRVLNILMLVRFLYPPVR